MNFIFIKATDADLLFTKSKAKYNAKSVPYSEFRANLIPGIATKKNTEEGFIMQQIANCEGVVLSGTVADNVRFHDEGTNSTPATRRGSASGVATPARKSSVNGEIPAALPQVPVSESTEEMVLEKFKLFCGTNNEMDSKQFSKMCKDAELYDKKFTGQ